LVLALKTRALYCQQSGGAEIVESTDGEALPLGSDTFIEQRSLGLDDAEVTWPCSGNSGDCAPCSRTTANAKWSRSRCCRNWKPFTISKFLVLVLLRDLRYLL